MNAAHSVAIVGVGGIFPQSPDLDDFWRLVEQGRDASESVPPRRWPVTPETLLDSSAGKPDRVRSLKGCFLADHQIEPDQGSLVCDPDLLTGLDPVFKLGVAAAQRAWQDCQGRLAATARTGVIIGNIVLPTDATSQMTANTVGRTFAEAVAGPESTQSALTSGRNGFAAGLPATIIARALGLGGGALTLDAACASSLYALKLAVDELRQGKVDAVLSGGMSRPDCLYTQMGFTQLRAISQKGQASPFDAAADGLIVGEGAGFFVLKRLADALVDGDRIYATIAGIGLSNDLDGSLLAPSSEGQVRAMRAAYAEAGWQPGDVSMIECHATGTPLGDGVEFSSLATLWADTPVPSTKCVIGSVKANVGHLLTGAGAASLMKVLLAMKHRRLPPTANFRNAADGIQLHESPFRILTASEDWPTDQQPRRAAVSAFGFGGINAHVLLEEWAGQVEATQAAECAAQTRSTVEKPAPIAIVGLAAQIGADRDLDAVAARLLGREAKPAEPIDLADWGMSRSRWFKTGGHQPRNGNPVRDVSVPIGRFRIPPLELQEMLPQQVLMLQVAADALADAAMEPEARTRAGAFVGIGLDLNTTNFQLRWRLEQQAPRWWSELAKNGEPEQQSTWLDKLKDGISPALNANRTIGALGGMVASRIARELKFGGSSFTVSSEQTSGLHALEAAVHALQAGRLDLALVGGVDFWTDPRLDLEGSSALPADGAVALVLKQLDAAERDGDAIYATIAGIGKSVATVEPHEDASARALHQWQGDPRRLGLVEGGASADLTGFAAAADGELDEQGHLRLAPFVADAATRLGDLGAARGMSSLLSAVLSLHHRILPPASQIGTGLGESHPKRTRLPMAWLRNRGVGNRAALVAERSEGDNRVAVILEEHRATSAPRPLFIPEQGVFFFSAATHSALLDQLSNFQRWAALRDAASVQELARAWWLDHQHQPGNVRLALVAVSRTELAEVLQRAMNEQPTVAPYKRAGETQRQKLFWGQGDPLRPAEIAFVFPGSGSHYADMGRRFGLLFPEVFQAQDELTHYFRDQIRPDLFWSGLPNDRLHDDVRALLSAQVALGATCSDLMRGFGLQPGGVLGYSLGETVGFFSTRAWRDRDGMHLRTMQSELFKTVLAGRYDAAHQVWALPAETRANWVVGVVNKPEAEVRRYLADEVRAYLLIVNSPRECVLGGDPDAVANIVARLEAQWFPLNGVVSVHCEVLQPAAEDYRNHHLFPTEPPQGIAFYRGHDGAKFEVNRESAADAILAQARHGVHFPKAVRQAYTDGFRFFLEMGPGASCTRMIDDILGDQPHIARSIGRSGTRPIKRLTHLLAELFAAGAPIKLDQLFHGVELKDRDQASSPKTLELNLDRAPFKILTLPKPNRTIKPSNPLVNPAEHEAVVSPKTPLPKQPSVETPLTVPGKPVESVPPQAATPIPERSGPLPEASTDLNEMVRANQQHRSAHEAYLRFAGQGQEILAQELNYQMTLLQQLGEGPHRAQWRGSFIAEAPQTPQNTAATEMEVEGPAQSEPTVSKAPVPQQPARDDLAFDREACLEFARGSIEKVLGQAFATVDQYPTRVRLPDEPLMLVDRILEVGGASMDHGFVVTEHDVLHDGWYLDGGRIPTCIAVEAGQADLFLSAYLGIDFETKGHAVYRLLDARVTFHDELPKAGQVIHYDIKIERFFRQGGTYFFRFQFDGTVNGKPLLTMRDGCAGFFSEEALAAGKGIVQSSLMTQPSPKQLPADWVEFVPMVQEAFDDRQIAALRAGDLAGCFGPAFANLPVKQPETLPSGLMELVHRVLVLEPRGGRFGLGFIRAEADIQPDDWFLTCHFVDDKVMPGTLMYECCLHTLRIFLMRMGWVGERGAVVHNPVPGVTSQLKCRGQVLDTTRKVRYEVVIKELGYRPEPNAIVDALMYSDEKCIVEITNMSLRMNGTDKQQLVRLWRNQTAPTAVRDLQPLYDRASILAFATGKPSEAFGEPYRVFDEQRVIARLPGPPFMFLDRVVAVEPQPWQMVPGGPITAEYDVPADAWYFEADRQGSMPFVVLLEIALQPCGWLAAYVGSALQSPVDVSFRNLGGKAVQHRALTPTSGTLSIIVSLTKVSASGGMIIQNYDFRVNDAHGTVYEGDTYFGFFSKQALANQVGIREAKPFRPALDVSAQEPVNYPTEAPFPDASLRMIDTIDVYLPEGGPAGLGWIRGRNLVDPDAWFFKAHFYQDPVIPGSLGLESFLQLLKYVAVARWGATPSTEFAALALGQTHEWVYRGQVIPSNGQVTVEAVILECDDTRKFLRADGYLFVDGKPIYQMKNFALRSV